MTNYILETNNLTKQFGNEKIIENINLKIPTGTIYGLLGPNGAGKSTTLKMITGIIQPTSGAITFENQPWSRQALNDIGALIELPPLYPNLTAYENMLVRATTLGLSTKIINEKLALVKLTNTGKKKVKQFSLGMKQRLGLALALLNDPKLLILDEPTNGLDPLGIQELRTLIRSLAKTGVTIIFSSHILSEIAQLSDEIAIITGGELHYQGKVPSSQDELEKLFMQVTLGNGGQAL